MQVVVLENLFPAGFPESQTKLLAGQQGFQVAGKARDVAGIGQEACFIVDYQFGYPGYLSRYHGNRFRHRFHQYYRDTLGKTRQHENIGPVVKILDTVMALGSGKSDLFV